MPGNFKSGPLACVACTYLAREREREREEGNELMGVCSGGAFEIDMKPVAFTLDKSPKNFR